LRQKLIDADKKFARELRTIQRLLQALSHPDFKTLNIERDDRSKPFGYRFKSDAVGLTLPSLSPQEALLLTLAERQLAALLPARLMKSMEGFFSQARRQLDDAGPLGAGRPNSATARHSRSARLEHEWLSKVRVVSTSQPLLPPKVDAEVFQQVSDALYNNQWLELVYQNAEGKKTQAKVMPLGLAQQGPCMYLVCRYDGYDNERSLALHRIQSASASTLTFERPEDFNLQTFDENGRFGYGDGTRIRLSFRIEKAAGLHIVECPLSQDQTVVELEDEYQITATVVDSLMLEWWLRGFGDGVWDIEKLAI
jgi:predicted DNA-binding transcriptional regulator YafY